jgi:signal transduction histidine kinase
VNLADIVTALLDNAAFEVRTLDLDVHLELQPTVVTGVPVLIERMVSNLIENAIAYNHVGGRIDISTGYSNGEAELRIGNSGPAIAADTVGRLLEPFVRGDGPRLHSDRGAGLGLSIVRTVVSAHDGDISVSARPGGGLDVVARLPVLRWSAPDDGALDLKSS